MNKNKGFTLIEVLVVIAVIGILASILLVGLSSVSKQGRDARRIADMATARNLLEIYNAKCGNYPGTVCASGGASIGSAWTDLETSLREAGVIGASDKIPVDPGGATSYLYCAVGGAARPTSYIIRARLSSNTNPALNDDLDGSTFTCQTGVTMDCADTVDGNYCVRL